MPPPVGNGIEFDMDNIIECENLTLDYDGEVVISSLSFEVRRGEILLVSGENGSGKSTLIRALLGLKKPLSGSVRMNGVSGGGVGYLPQQSGIRRDFPATVRETVLSGFVGRLRFGIFYPKDAETRANDAMRRTGVLHLASRPFNELSGGQAQRTLLARALCAADDLLILDEPTNGLDSAAAADMYSLIGSLRGDGVTVIMVSHDLSSSVETADRVLHLCPDGAFCCPSNEYEKRVAEAHGSHTHTHLHEHEHGHRHEYEHGHNSGQGEVRSAHEGRNKGELQ